MTFNINPLPVTSHTVTDLMGYDNTSMMYGSYTTLSLFQNFVYDYYGHVYINNSTISTTGNITIAVTGLYDSPVPIEISKFNIWISYLNTSCINGQFHFKFPVEFSEMAQVYQGILIIFYKDMHHFAQHFIKVNWITGASYNVQTEVNLPLLFILVFVPSLTTGALLTKYNLGFVGFFSGINIMTAISYQVSFVPLWFLFAIIIIDIILILELLHNRGSI
jgi:hypothetical protein